jgi:GNAT superfamily N-acetyltransferase
MFILRIAGPCHCGPLTANVSPHVQVMPTFSISGHDGLLPSTEASVVDEGLGEFNEKAAPLHEVKPLSCFAKDSVGTVIGGAVGRRWGACAELQQLRVHESRRRCGIGTELLCSFEEQARLFGCESVFLETFTFQAPALYLSNGYRVAYENKAFPHAIAKFHMYKNLGSSKSAG